MKHIKIHSSVGVNVGNIRENNEDNFYYNGWHLTEENREMAVQFAEKSDDAFQMYAVCDGMGGEECGEEASLIAVQTLKKYHDMLSNITYHNFDKYIDMCLIEASNIIDEKSYEIGCRRIGTTIALFCYEGNKIHIYNVGDSRIYRLHKKRLKQVTEDHTQVMRGIKMGTIRPEEAKTHPHRNKLTQYLGVSSAEMIIKPYSVKFKPKNSDIYLICSDGLTDMVDDVEIEKILNLKISEKEKVNILIEKAMANGGRDNISAIVVKIDKKFKLFK